MPKPPEPILLSNLSVASSISDKENLCADSVGTSLKYEPSFFAGAAITTVSGDGKRITACPSIISDMPIELKSVYLHEISSFSYM
jgi:hypothetical protein